VSPRSGSSKYPSMLAWVGSSSHPARHLLQSGGVPRARAPDFPGRARVARQPLTERSFDMARGFLLAIASLALLIGLTVAPSADAGGNVSIDVQINPPPVVVTAPPPLVVILGPPVSYAPSAPVNYFAFGGRFYTFHNRAWFSATVFNGPWVYVPVAEVPPPVLAVPVKYYKSPP